MKENELVKQCLKGQLKAQHELYDCFSDKLYRLVLRYVKDQAEAEDLIMISFVKIFKHISSFNYQGEGSLEAWMRRIVVNEALMCLRRQHNFHLTETLASDLPLPDLSSFQSLDAEYLYQLILDLPVGYRTVFNLYVVEGYDHKEIAQMLGISENTSRSQLLKAKLLLKKRLTQEGYQYGT